MYCQVKCNAKCKLLGGLEQKIIDALWLAGQPLKPAEVQNRLDRKYSYTTVMTVLKRLSDKKIVKRELNKRVFYYYPSQDKETFTRECLADLFERLFQAYGPQVSDCFYESAKKAGIKT